MKYKRTRSTLSRWQVELYINLHIDSFKTTLYTSDMYMNRLVVKGTSELEMEFVKIGTNNVKEITQQYEMLFSCTHWMLCIMQCSLVFTKCCSSPYEATGLENTSFERVQLDPSVPRRLEIFWHHTNCEDIFVLNIFLRGLKVAHVNLMYVKIQPITVALMLPKETN